MMRWLRGAILAALFVGAAFPAAADGPAGQPWINGSNQLYFRGAPSGLSILPSLMPAFTGGDCTSSVNSISLSCPGLGKLSGNQTWSGNNTFTGALVGPYGTLPGTGTNGQIFGTSGGLYAYYNGQWNGPFSTSGQNPTVPNPSSLTSGTNATYSTPAGAKWLEVTLVGGGGGGAGGGTGGGGAGNGGSTYWSTTSPASTSPMSTAGGGNGGGGAGSSFTSGGTTAGTCNALSVGGGQGSGGGYSTSGGVIGLGGAGGSSTLGGAGAPNSGAAASNSGSGGAGGASGNGVTAYAGIGGAAGATCKLIISNPVSTYYYTIGTGGTAGAAGTGGNAGAAGAAGQIIVIPHYNY